MAKHQKNLNGIFYVSTKGANGIFDIEGGDGQCPHCTESGYLFFKKAEGTITAIEDLEKILSHDAQINGFGRSYAYHNKEEEDKDFYTHKTKVKGANITIQNCRGEGTAFFPDQSRCLLEEDKAFTGAYMMNYRTMCLNPERCKKCIESDKKNAEIYKTGDLMLLTDSYMPYVQEMLKLHQEHDKGFLKRNPAYKGQHWSHFDVADKLKHLDKQDLLNQQIRYLFAEWNSHQRARGKARIFLIEMLTGKLKGLRFEKIYLTS